jgi:hypothetical protein
VVSIRSSPSSQPTHTLIHTDTHNTIQSASVLINTYGLKWPLWVLLSQPLLMDLRRVLINRWAPLTPTCLSRSAVWLMLILRHLPPCFLLHWPHEASLCHTSCVPHI